MPEHEQTQLRTEPAVPGWTSPFQPEKPRRDQDPSQQPAGLPTAAAVAAASALGEEAAADFTHEDRRPLDARRRRARGIDSLIIAPIAFGLFKLNGGVTIGLAALVLAIELSYFFVLESVQGQTIGKKMMKLRVVHPDGSAPSTLRIAARTILRPIDYTVIGIVAVLSSGPRRLRLGDRLANTIVRDDNRVFNRAPESPLLVVLPLLWIGLGVAALVGLKPADPLAEGRSSHPYMAKIDGICEKQARQGEALEANGQLTLVSARLIQQQELRKIERLPKAPAAVRADVREVLRQERRIKKSLANLSRELERSPNPGAVAAQQGPAIAAVLENAQRRFKELGLPSCARSYS